MPAGARRLEPLLAGSAEMGADLDLSRLHPWLAVHLPDHCEPVAAEKFPGGQSNPTYRLDVGDMSYVLRRQPSGVLLPSAHAVDREFRLLSALHPLGFPVPRPVSLCGDTSVIGAMFYVMERVDGRTFWDGKLPGLQTDERSEIYREMITALARLHSVDFIAAGLEDFKRPGNFFERQVTRWTKQYRASQTEYVDEIEQLIGWLPGSIPAEGSTSIVHGDYRIDNLIFSPDRSRLLAVIDWELATVGDPLADLAYLLMNWILPFDQPAGLSGIDFAEAGIPTMKEAIEIYCSAANRASVPDLHWHFAFNLFRLAAILQGVRRRMLDGNASNAHAEQTVARMIPLARAGCEQAQFAKSAQLGISTL